MLRPFSRSFSSSSRQCALNKYSRVVTKPKDQGASQVLLCPTTLQLDQYHV